MKYIFIVNPNSGNINLEVIKANIEKAMEGLEYKIVETRSPNHATRIALKYKNEENAIVYSVGGDGTLNEVINGIAGGKCKLGVIPCGSGNDFYKSLEKYSKKESTIDLGVVNDKFYFINIASVGFDAQVCNEANLIKEAGKHKKISYYLGILKTFIKFRFQEYEIEYNDKKVKGKYTIIAICNGRYYGGGFQIAPLASFDDDLFDIYFADKMGRIRLIGVLIKLVKAKHEKSKLVKKVKTTSIKLSSDKDMILNIDGEIIKLKKAEIRIVPNAVTIYNDKNLVKKIIDGQ
ncbi:MAG: diacylglycerol kinase family lipid kinase [Bacilli bacterium]|nr:diacylglycerol kinase family lipid kinase [Bacilli bacterium]